MIQVVGFFFLILKLLYWKFPRKYGTDVDYSLIQDLFKEFFREFSRWSFLLIYIRASKEESNLENWEIHRIIPLFNSLPIQWDQYLNNHLYQHTLREHQKTYSHTCPPEFTVWRLVALATFHLSRSQIHCRAQSATLLPGSLSQGDWRVGVSRLINQ